MPKVYRISKSMLHLYFKVRHHRGHGVHSPFVYNLITKVIEEKSPYYLYKDIQETIHNNPDIYKNVSKYDLLSFRLVNYFNPVKVLEIGSGKGINTLCLTAPSSRIECNCIELSEAKYTIAQSLYKNWNRNIILHTIAFPEVTEKQDCIYIDLDKYFPETEWVVNNLLNLVHEESFIIVRGIRTKKRNQMLWKVLKKSEKVSISLDLYKEGILFFNPKLYKRNYIISF